GRTTKAPPVERGGQQICSAYSHRATSRLYHERTFRDDQATSAMTPKADIARAFMSTRRSPCGRIPITDVTEYWLGLPRHSGLMAANFTTLPHFSVSAAMSLPKSAGEPPIAIPPDSASRVLNAGSPRPALISLLSRSMISAGVLLGAPIPYQVLAP